MTSRACTSYAQEKKEEEIFDGKSVAKIRLRMKMNQSEFGALLGYHQPQIRISEIETGRKRVPKRIEMVCGEIKKKIAAHWERRHPKDPQS